MYSSEQISDTRDEIAITKNLSSRPKLDGTVMQISQINQAGKVLNLTPNLAFNHEKDTNFSHYEWMQHTIVPLVAGYGVPTQTYFLKIRPTGENQLNQFLQNEEADFTNFKHLVKL